MAKTLRFSGLREGDASTHRSMPSLLSIGTGSSQSMRQARGWLDECRLRHKKCAKGSIDYQIPTRLVYVSIHPYLGVIGRVCHRDYLHAKTPYLTLSHRWPEKKPITLSTKTIKDFYYRIPEDALTAVFYEALTVTLKLGHLSFGSTRCASYRMMLKTGRKSQSRRTTSTVTQCATWLRPNFETATMAYSWCHDATIRYPQSPTLSGLVFLKTTGKKDFRDPQRDLSLYQKPPSN